MGMRLRSDCLLASIQCVCHSFRYTTYSGMTGVDFTGKFEKVNGLSVFSRVRCHVLFRHQELLR